ncbi:MAG: DUF115 domain-containing protein [Synergistaceae bacterium]|nr:DUF115 domain-containing protein [Synergistaceae bacterium]
MAKEIVRAPGDLSVWRENIEILARRQPALARTLQVYVAGIGHGLEHYEEKTPAGRWITGLTESPFFEPAGEPVFAWSKKTREPALFFLYGTGAHPYLAKSIKSLPREAVSLLVVEPNIALLAYALHVTRVYADVPSGCGISFFTVPDIAPGAPGFPDSPGEMPEEREKLIRGIVECLKEEALSASVSAFGVFSIAGALATIHAGEECAMEGSFRNMAMAISEWSILRAARLGNSAEDTLLGLRQMALMAPWISYGYQFSSLIGKYAGRPFVVVSAGPSLDKNFGLLREVCDKFVIIASDAVLGKMIRSGMMPHIVCCLERGLPTYDAYFASNLDKYASECRNILLLAQSVCTPKIYGRWPGPKMLIGKGELPLDRWFIEDVAGGSAIRSGSSVAHTCYSAAVSMGASKIALLGQDLAFAEDGFTHAEGVYGEGARRAMRKKDLKSSPGIIKAPGALGGEVCTNDIFLMFLHELESMISDFGIPAHDCTEGGALIQGTEIEPFASFIARETLGLSPIADDEKPAAAVLSAGLPPDRERLHAGLAERVRKSELELGELEKTLEDIKAPLAGMSSPGLDSKRRFAYAMKIGRAFNDLNKKNPMLAFVTQSYASSSAALAAKSRMLDTVDAVRSWTSIYGEMIAAHRSVIAFVRQWLHYAGDALGYYADRELPLAPPDAPSFEMIEALFARPDSLITLRFEMDYLTGALDMARLGWPGRTLWQCAMFLLDEGRAAEAGVLMEAALKDFDGSEMAESEAAAFLKDHARVLASPDLCHFPPYERAELLLNNAVERFGADGEVREIGRKILNGEIKRIRNLAAYEGSNPDRLIEWKTSSHRATVALWDGDVLKAMSIVWEMIRDAGVFFPGLASAHLDWLARQMEKFLGAEDEPYRSGIDGLLSGMASRADILGKFPIMYSVPFVRALASHGLGVAIAPEREEIGVIGR